MASGRKGKAEAVEKPSDDLKPAGLQKSADIGSAGFPVVGIGASAGGLAAFEAFFSGMPADTDTGMAFVLVQHLAPDHTSLLAGLIRRYTRMQVFEVEDGMRVKPNCTYIIPPGRDMAFLNGTLHLLEPSIPRGQRLTIDFFFRSLAQDQHERAIGVILSGTGSDGSQGLLAIKGEGGMVMAQDPDSCEFDGMPRSAIATGVVDYVLPPAEMPTRLIDYTAHAFGKPHIGAGSVPIPDTLNMLKKIFILLRAQTGHDFSQYKPSTVSRRIERRMAIHQIENIDGYVKYLQQTPSEGEALFRDLLIGVTYFFRDAEAFKRLEEEVIPRLFALKPSGGTIRVWTAGCSSGEEAYSIAILLKERMDELKQNYAVQLFATDIDPQAIARARAGLYPVSIADAVTSERLARFFTALPDGSGYRIHKSIRDMLIFSEQNIIKDPPFSRLDLISCRNLLIYMGQNLQKRLIPLFHYALNPEGFLFLGTSESVGEFGDLFRVLDQKSKLYQRKESESGVQRRALGNLLAPAMRTQEDVAKPLAKTAGAVKMSLRELTEKALLRKSAVAGVLVNERGDILYLHGRSGIYLELPSGETGVNNILKMAKDGLQHDLMISLRKAVTTKQSVQRPGLYIKNEEGFAVVNLAIHPVHSEAATASEPLLYLVVLEEVPPMDLEQARQFLVHSAAGGSDTDIDADTRIAALKEELHAQESFLQAANDKLQMSNEELNSFNEEMQSLNEELQSTNEELETSKEELQSVNEELSTVNAELQTKVSDLSRANNDMNNLLAGTGIGTVFVDCEMRILRFTPAATTIINLVLNDLGRPVTHLASNLVEYNTLAADTQSVLDTLIPKEMEVMTSDGKWYLMRIQPYRTLDNTIEGAVISFINITENVQMRKALKEAEAMNRLAVVVRDAHDAITLQDLNGRILAWNPAAVRIYGWSEAEALKMNAIDRVPEQERENALAKLLQLSHAEILEPYRAKRIDQRGYARGGLDDRHRPGE